MKFIPHTIAAAALLFVGASQMQAQKSTLRTDKSLDVDYYHLRLGLPIERHYVIGETDVYFKTDSINIRLDLSSSLKVNSVKGAGDYRHDKDALYIRLDGTSLLENGRRKITINYEGTPLTIDQQGTKRGLVYKEVGKDKTPIIAAVSEPEHAYLWFPCHNTFGDKADSMRIDITIPDKNTEFVDDKGKKQKVPYTAVANGKLAQTLKNDDGTRTYVWKTAYPIHPQYATVAVGDFAKSTTPWMSEETGEKFPLHFYVRPADMEAAKGVMLRVPEIMTCLTNTFGNYPFAKEGFSLVHLSGISTGKYGTNTQGIVLMEDLMGIHIYRIVHSLSHQWFGNHITPENWQDSWVTEALATYGESIWHEYKRSVRGYQIMLEEKEFFAGGKLYLEKPSDYSEERLNKKGIWVLHMLRGIMGDQYFYETLKGINEGKRLKKSTITTGDFRQLCEYYAGENVKQNYEYFFDQWVMGEMFPVYEVQYENLKKGGVKLVVSQRGYTTKPNQFRMPVRVQLTFADGTTKAENITLNATPLQSLTIATTQPVTNLEFDHGYRILKKLLFTRQIINTKAPIVDFEVVATDDRREFQLSCNVTKKQDLSIELIQVADMVLAKTDTVIAKQDFKAVQGAFKQTFKIPLALDKRNNYIVRLVGKSDVYTHTLRLLQLVNKFEKEGEKDE